MKRDWFIGAVATFVLYSSLAVAQDTQLDSAVLDKIKSATVLIIANSPDSGTLYTGSGFFISADGKIITNAHVVLEPSTTHMGGEYNTAQISIVINSGTNAAEVVPAAVIGLGYIPHYLDDGTVFYDPDLALVQAKVTHPCESLALETEPSLKETQPVYAAGFPLSMPEISIREGTISSLRHNESGELAYIEHTAGLDPGNSGGPLLSTNGIVLGINTWLAGFNSNTAISSSIISEFLDSPNKISSKASSWASKIGVTPADEVTLPPGSPTAMQAYREVLAFAAGINSNQVGQYKQYLDNTYAQLERSAYRFSIIPEFALAVIAAEAHYGKRISWARYESWVMYERTTNRKLGVYPNVLEDMDTALSELNTVMQESKTVDEVFNRYWCGPDGFNVESFNNFREAASKLWNGLEPYAKQRIARDNRSAHTQP